MKVRSATTIKLAEDEAEFRLIKAGEAAEEAKLIAADIDEIARQVTWWETRFPDKPGEALHALRVQLTAAREALAKKEREQADHELVAADLTEWAQSAEVDHPDPAGPARTPPAWPAPPTVGQPLNIADELKFFTGLPVTIRTADGGTHRGTLRAAEPDAVTLDTTIGPIRLEPGAVVSVEPYEAKADDTVVDAGAEAER